MFSGMTIHSKSKLMHEGLEFKFRESKSMETVVGNLKSETIDGLKCSPQIKKLMTSIGTSTRESGNYANFKCIFDSNFAISKMNKFSSGF